MSSLNKKLSPGPEALTSLISMETTPPTSDISISTNSITEESTVIPTLEKIVVPKLETIASETLKNTPTKEVVAIKLTAPTIKNPANNADQILSKTHKLKSFSLSEAERLAYMGSNVNLRTFFSRSANVPPIQTPSKILSSKTFLTLDELKEYTEQGKPIPIGSTSLRNHIGDAIAKELADNDKLLNEMGTAYLALAEQYEKIREEFLKLQEQVHDILKIQLAMPFKEIKRPKLTADGVDVSACYPTGFKLLPEIWKQGKQRLEQMELWV